HLDASLIGDRVQIHLPEESTGSILTLNLGDDAALSLTSKPQIPVECISSAHEAEQPVALYWDGQRNAITAILTRWRDQNGRGFRVRVENLQQFKLFYSETTHQWSVEPYVPEH
ncbi:MAG: hypothetical protein JW750_07300, partial [Anaerolineaceae bacterium]|nr:hypothetical protein [Anaerolineaceae bacterium]